MSLDILSSMELSATVIGSAVSVIVVLISYLVYKIGIGEKSFEEVIEEQKRRSIEEEQKQKSEKVKKEKKFKKTWGKKSKEKPESAEVSHESTPVPEMKDAVMDIEIIEPKQVKPPKQNKKSKASSNSSQESSPVQEKPKKSENAQVQEKAKKPENQDKAKNQEAPAVQEKAKKLESSGQEKVKKSESSPVQEKAVQEKKKAVSEVEKGKESKVEVKETATVMQKSVQTASQPSATAQKKKKKDQVEKDAVPMTINKLMSWIKESELEAEEIQNFIDVLLNKQKDSTGWTKVNDDVAVTKKHLQEKEQLLEIELKQNQAVTTKLKELREEYNGFKTKTSAQEKASLEKIMRQQQDIQTLTTKVKQVQEQLQAGQIEKNEKLAQDSIIKSLEEEKANLLQKIAILETESLPGVSKSDFESLKKSREDLQKVHALLVEQHTQLVSAQKNELKSVQSQVSDSKAKVEDINAQNLILSKEIQALKESKSASELARKTLEDKLKAEEKRSVEVDVQIKQLSKATVDVTKLQAELKDLRLENERLSEQLVTTKERVAGDGQEIVHQNGEFNGKPQLLEKSFDDKVKLLEEKETLVTQLNDDVLKLKSKISHLNEEVEVQKQKNNELREKNWKAMEAVENVEKTAEQKIKEIQSSADQKCTLLEKDLAAQKQATSTMNATSALTEQLKKAENEAAQRFSDFNKEVEKTNLLPSQVREITAEISLQRQRITEMQETIKEYESSLTNCQSRTKECLQRICPSISIDSSLSYEKWLSEFEQQATSAIQSVVTQSSNSVNLEELLKEKEGEYLQKQKHYDQVLAETESTLSKLQKVAESLQERLGDKEQELQKVLSERDALAAEKEASGKSTSLQLRHLEEMQEKLKLLRNTLETAESDRSQLQQKYDEVNKNYLNLKDQLESNEKQLAELQKESSGLEKLNKEIDDLKSKLEKEKIVSKDFSSQMIKLNSYVKIGQDALKEEQEMVKSLKQQIEAATKISTANGTASATKASPVTNSESEPKTKSSQKSKKKMDASDKN